MDDFNPYAAPRSEIAPDDSHLTGEGGLWRDGPLLMIRKGTELPDRCVKCNGTAGGYRLKRTLSWHPSYWFLLVLVSPLIYIIVALCVRKTAKVAVGLCERHRSARRRAIAVGWLLSLAGIGLIVLSGYDIPFLNLAGIGVLVGGILFGIIRSQVLVPKRIDQNFVWLKKVSPEYLAALPRFGEFGPEIAVTSFLGRG
jgi:hypothetical protein